MRDSSIFTNQRRASSARCKRVAKVRRAVETLHTSPEGALIRTIKEAMLRRIAAERAGGGSGTLC